MTDWSSPYPVVNQDALPSTLLALLGPLESLQTSPPVRNVLRQTHAYPHVADATNHLHHSREPCKKARLSLRKLGTSRAGNDTGGRGLIEGASHHARIVKLQEREYNAAYFCIENIMGDVLSMGCVGGHLWRGGQRMGGRGGSTQLRGF